MSHFTILLCLFFAHTVAFADHQPKPTRILIGSPIRKSPAILKEFLSSLQQLKQNNIIIDYFFIDDNVNATSSELLQNFLRQVNHCFILKAPSSQETFLCDETTHYWTDQLVWKVAQFKNKIISVALLNDYDYLFLVDSDLLLNPNTLEHLVACNKDIVSEIFWTRFHGPDQPELPQVWLSDIYDQTDDFLKKLHEPGIYEVGGLGACTLINKKTLITGVNFNKLHNITFPGEDRHFCIRAVALGLSLFVDTHFPAYHIYRESELAGIAIFKKNNNLK